MISEIKQKLNDAKFGRDNNPGYRFSMDTACYIKHTEYLLSRLKEYEDYIEIAKEVTPLLDFKVKEYTFMNEKEK